MIEIEKYKGYDIEIKQDECAENPFEAWDCNPPIYVFGDVRQHDYGLLEDLNLAEYYEYSGNELIKELRKQGIKHYKVEQRTGYCQGDVAVLLIAYTPKFIESMGIDEKLIDDTWFESVADLYASWCFGDVYGFNVSELDDNCCGFYGADHNDSGLLQEAKSTIDYHIKTLHEQKLIKLKKLIKNNVPIYKREMLLEQAK